MQGLRRLWLWQSFFAKDKEYLAAAIWQAASPDSNNEKIRHLASEDKTLPNRITLAAVVAYLITSVVTGLSPVTVAVLVVQEGLNILCSDK